MGSTSTPGELSVSVPSRIPVPGTVPLSPPEASAALGLSLPIPTFPVLCLIRFLELKRPQVPSNPLCGQGLIPCGAEPARLANKYPKIWWKPCLPSSYTRSPTPGSPGCLGKLRHALGVGQSPWIGTVCVPWVPGAGRGDPSPCPEAARAVTPMARLQRSGPGLPGRRGRARAAAVAADAGTG